MCRSWRHEKRHKSCGSKYKQPMQIQPFCSLEKLWKSSQILKLVILLGTILSNLVLFLWFYWSGNTNRITQDAYVCVKKKVLPFISILLIMSLHTDEALSIERQLHIHSLQLRKLGMVALLYPQQKVGIYPLLKMFEFWCFLYPAKYFYETCGNTWDTHVPVEFG